MVSKELQEQKHYNTRNDLLEHASLAVMRTARTGLFGVKNWITANVMNSPTVIHDINGKILFMDFTVKKGREILGYIRTGASKVIGGPVIAYELGPRKWDFKEALKKCTTQVKKKYKKCLILKTRLVCYSYPKLGIMFEMKMQSGKSSRLIFDIGSYQEIPEKKDGKNIEGAFAWSFYDSIPEKDRKKQIKRYDTIDQARLSLTPKKREKIRAAIRVDQIDKIDAGFLTYKKTVTKELQFCPHYDYDEPRSHHCFVLHAQQKWDYCAVASCQMILDFYRYFHSQDDIAPSLGYHTGGCAADQSGGYENLSYSHLESTYDTSPTWEKAKNEIDDIRPLKSGVPGHARAIAGYSYSRWMWNSQMISFGVTDKKLLVYDPSPWNSDYKAGGSIYWEDWDSITHTNFIYSQIKTS